MVEHFVKVRCPKQCVAFRFGMKNRIGCSRMLMLEYVGCEPLSVVARIRM